MTDAYEAAESGKTGDSGGEDGADAVLDLRHLDRQTDGDKALQRELLALFAGQAREVLGRITAGEEPAPLAHRLKGAARAVGAWGVAEAAGRMEAGADAGDALEVAVRQALARIAGHPGA